MTRLRLPAAFTGPAEAARGEQIGKITRACEKTEVFHTPFLL